jgi:hypothetical protein
MLDSQNKPSTFPSKTVRTMHINPVRRVFKGNSSIKTIK